MITDESSETTRAQSAEVVETEVDSLADADTGATASSGAENTFAELGIEGPVLAALGEMGFEKPTAVQVKAVPPALAGHDLLVQSHTGSGKTAAFAIPLCQTLIDRDRRVPQTLVLAPTRELARQVAQECTRVAAGQAIEIAAIYGGAPMAPQTEALAAGVHMVVGTPGRVLDHLRRRTLAPGDICTLVLDECDEMLSMGFQEELNAILDQLPAERQTLLFSATIPPEIERMVKRYLDEPTRISLSDDFVGVREIQHLYYSVSGGGRMEDLLRILEYENPSLALVFCNTREETARVAEFLARKGFAAEGISSDLSQRDRERVMKRMHAGELRFLAATDVAARGIDIPELSHVINYTFPESVDLYVHRTGRTGRAGRSGVAISLVSPREIGSFYYLKLIHKIYPEERHIPSEQELATRREAAIVQQLQARFGARRAPPQLTRLVQRIWSMVDAERLLALVLESFLAEETPTPTPTPPRPSPSKEKQAGRSRGEPRRGERSNVGSRDGASAVAKPRGGRVSQRDAPGMGSVATSDGEVEFYETRDAPAAPRERPEAARVRENAHEGMTALYLNVGRRHDVPPEDIASFVQIEAELNATELGAVLQRDRHTYVYVKSDLAESTIEKLAGKQLGEDRPPLRVEKAKSVK